MTSLFTSPDTLPRRARAKWLAPSVGLAAAAAITYLGLPMPRYRTLSWSDLLGLATVSLALAFFGGATTVWLLRFVRQAERPSETEASVLRTALAAIWFVPTIILLREGSGWAAVIIAVAAGGITALFRSLLGPYDFVVAEHYFSLFADDLDLASSRRRHSRLFAAVTMVLFAEVAAVACFAGKALIAAIAAAIGSALWAWFLSVDRAWSNPSRHSAQRAALIFSLALLVTVSSLIPYMKHARGSGGLGLFFAGRVGHRVSGSGEHEKGNRGNAANKGSGSSASGFDGAYSGIVLWSKKQEVTHLVAPTPVFGAYQIGSGPSANALVVPFSGVYWFFKAPDVRPPQGSREANGSPELVATRSTDRLPLSMEAHQYLGTLISLTCCSRIQITIRNTDRYPETVSLELILSDTSLPKRDSQSLGDIKVRSTRPWTLYGDRPVVGETLAFEIPPHPAINRFDEVTVVFHLDPMRADVGAKIGIEKFVLVPRGL